MSFSLPVTLFLQKANQFSFNNMYVQKLQLNVQHERNSTTLFSAAGVSSFIFTFIFRGVLLGGFC